MRSRFPLFVFLLAVFTVFPLRAAETVPPSAAQPAAELGVDDAIILGIVEGVTEFLPISSTGHLIIANELLGLDSEQQLTDKDGNALWYKKPSEKHPEGVPLTVKLAADTYAVVIQVGAISAVMLLYWHSLFMMLGGLLGRSSAGLRLLRNVCYAVVPVGIIGFLLNDLINQYLFSVGTVIIAQVVGAIGMLWAERWRQSNTGVGRAKGDGADLTPRKAVGIGLAQCLALWPGMSRSMVTIVGGYLAGLSPAKAAEFSFVVGLPVLAGAALLKSVKSGPAMIEVFGWGNVILGTLVAGVSALVAVKFFVHIISRYGLTFFAWYRLVLALVLVIFFYLL